jgi:hypothetical protein
MLEAPMVPDPSSAPSDPSSERLVAVAYKLGMAADALALIAAGDDPIEDVRAMAAAALVHVLRGWDVYPLLPGVLGDDDIATAFLDAATRP